MNGDRPDDSVLADVFGDQVDSIVHYHDILATRGVEWGLIGPRETDRLWCRHIMNSVSLRGLIDCGAAVVDVGSGAGLPGIPLALARPDLRVTLLDSLLRRTQFLEAVVDELGLTSRVSVVRARAEETGQSYDVVVARAVAPLVKLVPWCAQLMRGGLLALKGSSARKEIEDAAAVLQELAMVAVLRECETTPMCPPATVIEVSRSGKSSTS